MLKTIYVEVRMKYCNFYQVSVIVVRTPRYAVVDIQTGKLMSRDSQTPSGKTLVLHVLTLLALLLVHKPLVQFCATSEYLQCTFYICVATCTCTVEVCLYNRHVHENSESLQCINPKTYGNPTQYLLRYENCKRQSH